MRMTTRASLVNVLASAGLRAQLLAFVELPVVVLNVALCCKGLHALAGNWLRGLATLDLPAMEWGLPKRLFGLLASSCHAVRHLLLRSDGILDFYETEVLALLAVNRPHLRSFVCHVSWDGRNMVRSVLQALVGCRALTRLDLCIVRRSFYFVPPALLVLPTFPQLADLTLHAELAIQMELPASLACLRLSGPSEAALTGILLHAQQLRLLQLDATHISDLCGLASRLAEWPGSGCLEELDLTLGRDAAPPYLHCKASHRQPWHLPKLERLVVRARSNQAARGFWLPDCLRLRAPALRSVSVACLTRPDDLGLWPTTTPTLETINLGASLSRSELHAAAVHCAATLRELRLHVRRPTAADVRAVLLGCPLLESLHLETEREPDGTIATFSPSPAIASGADQRIVRDRLVRVHLDVCDRALFAGLELPALRDLVLLDAPRVPLHTVERCCPALRHLELGAIDPEEPEGTKGFAWLERLHWNVREMDVQRVARWLRRLPRLSEIQLSQAGRKLPVLLRALQTCPCPDLRRVQLWPDDSGPVPQVCSLTADLLALLNARLDLETLELPLAAVSVVRTLALVCRLDARTMVHNRSMCSIHRKRGVPLLVAPRPVAPRKSAWRKRR